MPLTWLSLAFLSGVFLASLWRAPWGTWLGIGLVPIAGILLLRRLPWEWAAVVSHRHPALKFAPLLLFTLFGAGGLRYSMVQPGASPADLAWYNDRGPVRLTGVVASAPDRREALTRLTLEVESLSNLDASLPERDVRGWAMVTVSSSAAWQYGDRLELTGEPKTPEENADFSYRDTLANRGIYTVLDYPNVQLLERGEKSWLLAGLYALRERASGVIEQILPTPEAPLLTGILLGDDTDLPETVVKAFQASGTAHIIAISGFNMAVLAGLFSTLFKRLLRRYWATLGAILTLVLYTLLVGGSPAVVRALIMSSLSLIAVQIGRPGGGLNALLLAAGLMCLRNPGLLWDTSFQLSCAATLGLILYAGPLQGAATRLLERRMPPETAQRVAAPLGEYFLFTLAAQAATLPILAFHFQRVSIGALLANPLILPPQPLVMGLGGLAVLAGMVWLPLGHLLSWVAWPFLHYSVRIAEIFGGLPGAELAINPIHPAWLAVYYVLLVGIAFGQGWWARVQSWLKPALVLTVTAALALLAWRTALAQPDGRLHVYLFNLEGQSAWLVRTPQGQTLLIDGFESRTVLSDALARRLPPTQRSLSAWLYTGTETNLKGLPGLFDRYPPQALYRCDDFPNRDWGNTLQTRYGELSDSILRPGQLLEMGTVVGEVISQEEGCGLVLNYERFKASLEGQSLRLWNGQVLAASSGGWLHLTTDGKQVWIEEGK